MLKFVLPLADDCIARRDNPFPFWRNVVLFYSKYQKLFDNLLIKPYDIDKKMWCNFDGYANYAISYKMLWNMCVLFYVSTFFNDAIVMIMQIMLLVIIVWNMCVLFYVSTFYNDANEVVV